MTFWIVTTLLALAVSALFALAMTRGRRDASDSSAGYDLRVYRDQLADVDRDLARGVIAEEDADRARTEISRRILTADAQAKAESAGQGPSRKVSMAAAALLALATLGASLLIYRELGAPGYSDLTLKHRIAMAEETRKSRPDQATAEARMPARPPLELEPEYKALIEQLRGTVAQRPDDIQGLALLARHEANSGNHIAAYTAQAQLIELKGEDATSRDYAEQGEMMIVAAGGYVSPEAELALRKALERDARNGPARYYWGLMLAQIGRPDLAFGIWEQTLSQGPAGTPWNGAIRDQIEEMAWRAGIDYQPPAPAAPPLAGLSAEDMQAAQDMSEEDRQQMIRGMVDRLSDRLATEGGSAAEWARLIGALGVLGDTDRARAIHAEARQVFADTPEALAEVEAAARQAGLVP